MVLNSISGLLEYVPEERLGIERYVRLLNEVDTMQSASAAMQASHQPYGMGESCAFWPG